MNLSSEGIMKGRAQCEQSVFHSFYQHLLTIFHVPDSVIKRMLGAGKVCVCVDTCAHMCLRTKGIWAFFQDDMWKRHLWVKIWKNLRYSTKNLKYWSKIPKSKVVNLRTQSYSWREGRMVLSLFDRKEEMVEIQRSIAVGFLSSEGACVQGDMSKGGFRVKSVVERWSFVSIRVRPTRTHVPEFG